MYKLREFQLSEVRRLNGLDFIIGKVDILKCKNIDFSNFLILIRNKSQAIYEQILNDLCILHLNICEFEQVNYAPIYWVDCIVFK